MEDLRALAKKLGSVGQNNLYLAARKRPSPVARNQIKQFLSHEGREADLSSTATEHRADWDRSIGRAMGDGLVSVHNRAVQGRAPNVSMDTGFD